MKRVLVLAALPLLCACQSMRSDAPRATASLQPTRGNQTSGTVTFVEAGGRVRVNAVVAGLKPGREHGFHVHEAGDCSSGDGMSTQGHFNPLGKPHAHFSTAERHAGDMPALRADANGRAEANFELDVMTVSPGPASVVGRGLIVHADPDDYRTQPTGNAGARIACAVIRRS
jgi:superoxide dismutase, Cu-Zn family